MIEIEDKLLSDDIVEEYFSCNLSECKGICCVDGDSGAPLEYEEIALIEDNIEEIKEYMTPEGVTSIEKDGVFTIDIDGDYTTTLINGGECAFVFRNGDIALCAIEKAYREGKIENIKPISCHLYPVRRKKLESGTDILNYHRWNICKGAIEHGEKTGCKVYQGVRSAIERAYGAEFYGHLSEVDRIIEAGEEIEEDI